MSRISQIALVAAPALLAAACGTNPIGPIDHLPRELSVAERQLVSADNRFAFKLFREVNRQQADADNVFISPLSVGMALGMTVNGAAGATRDSMASTLELGGMSLTDVNQSYRDLIDLLLNLDPAVTLDLANAIWYREGIAVVPDFIDRTTTYFDATVQALDFSDPASADIMNQWVRDETRNKIDGIVDPPIDPATIMFLMNAVYFYGDWTYQFDASRTADASFRRPDGSTKTVRMMNTGEEIPLRSYRDGDLLILELAYGGDAFAMTIAMPADPAAIGALADSVTQSTWDAWVAGLDSTDQVVRLPKFQIEDDVTLNDVLRAIGMGIAFAPDRADFSNLYAGPERAYISKVKHKAFVNVDEHGTEAAAVTSVEIGLTSAPVEIVVDRPFLFAIRERLTGALLFMGKVVDP